MQLRTHVVGITLRRVQDAGADAEALRARFGLAADAWVAPEVILPLKRFHAFCDAAAALSSDPFLGLTVAARAPLGTFRLVEYTCRSAPTMRDAVTRMVRYMRVLNEIVDVALKERGDEATLHHEVPGVPVAMGRHGNEFFLAWFTRTFRSLIGADFTATCARFAHAAPGDVAPIAAALGTDRISFGHEANALVFPRAYLDRPMASADPVLLGILEREAERALGEQPHENRFIGEVRRRVRERLAEGPPTLESLAAELRMSPRTLQRRLGDADTSLSDLVDDLRSELARSLVQEGRALSEIAYVLGYTEPRAFARAFRRWTGTTPRRLRSAP